MADRTPRARSSASRTPAAGHPCTPRAQKDRTRLELPSALGCALARCGALALGGIGEAALAHQRADARLLAAEGLVAVRRIDGVAHAEDLVVEALGDGLVVGAAPLPEG